MENASPIEGFYLMKLVDKKLTVGMSATTIAKTTAPKKVASTKAGG